LVGGMHCAIRLKFALEATGGWTVDRRHGFHGRDPNFNDESAPYARIGFDMQLLLPVRKTPIQNA